MQGIAPAQLRAFVALAESGTLNAAASVVSRTPSAVSLQIAALEAFAGQALFERSAKGMALSKAGEVFLGFARRMLELESQARHALTGVGLTGVVRFGMPQDFADTLLAQTLATFTRLHPDVRFDAFIGRNSHVATRMSEGALDLALLISARKAQGALASVRQSVRWFAHPAFQWNRKSPLPLVLLEEPCIFRKTALAALDASRIRHRIVFTTSNVPAMWAAVASGAGVTARMALGAPRSTEETAQSHRLPALSSVSLSLCAPRKRRSDAVVRLAQLVAEALDRA